MKLTKRKILYSVCAVIVACCVCVNLNRERKEREAMAIEARYKSIYETEKREALNSLKYRYEELVREITDRRKSYQWREERLDDLCALLGFKYGYHGQHFMINDFAEINREHRAGDMRIMREAAELRAEEAERKARQPIQK